MFVAAGGESGDFEFAECGVQSLGGDVAFEDFFGDGAAWDFLGFFDLQSGADGDGVSAESAEANLGGADGVFADGERGIQVREANDGRTVEQRLDKGEADGVGLHARGHFADDAGALHAEP